MRLCSSRTEMGCKVGASVAVLTTAFCLALPAAAWAAEAGAPASVRPPVATKNLPSADDTRQVTRQDEEFAAIGALLAQRRKGLPFAEHEVEILDAWAAGLPVAQIEAETLLSGAIYRLFIEGSAVSGAERDLVARWRAYRAGHVDEILARAAQLVGADPRDVAAPDGSRDFELYWDPELYNQLSSAYQRRLQRIYGFRNRARSATVPAGSGAEAPASPTVVPPNILVNDSAFDATTQDTQSETGLVLGSSSKILVAFNDSGSDFAPNPSFTGIARSTDGGATFTDQGRLPATATSDAGDPVLVRNTSTGRAFLSTLGFNSASVLQCFRSDDDGATYQPPVDCDGVGATGNNDKEWLAVDNFTGSGQGNVYNFYRDFGTGGGMSISRSTDGGATWSARQVLAAASGQGAFPVVGANHAVYAFWLATTALVARKSTDQGVTFGAQSTVHTLRTTGTNGDLALGGGFRTNAFPQIVANPVDASQLYMVWNDKGVSPSPDKANIYFGQSTDGGATWSAELQVNTDAGTHDNWQPTIAITPDGTKLFVSWYDRRNDAANSLIDVFARMGSITGSLVAFGGDFQLNDVSFPVVIGQDSVINSVYMGDYDTAVADNANFYRTWGDNRLPRLTHTHQPDVRFAAIPATGPGPLPVANGLAVTSESCTPANSAPDPGELMTVDLTLTNGGSAATTNLVGTLQATGGVTNPSAPRTFGSIPITGSVTRSYSFTVGGTCGDAVTLSLQLQDGATDDGTAHFGPLANGTTTSAQFSNLAGISIADNTAATPYPSIISVSGVAAYSRVTVALNGVTHTFPADIDIVAVAPTGAKAYVLSDTGNGNDVTGVNLTLDDAAASEVGTPIAPGTFRPTNLDTTTDAMPAPAPAGPYDGTFVNFAGLGAAANGIWSLYVRDDAAADTGAIAGGWTLSFVTHVCATACSNLIFSDGFESGGVCLWSLAVGNSGVCLTQP